MNNIALIIGIEKTLIKNVDQEEWEVKNGLLAKIRSYYNKGYIIIFISNRTVLDNFSSEVFTQKMGILVKKIEDYIAGDVNYGYPGDKNFYHMMPNPGMAYHVAIELTLDLRSSIMIGNSEMENLFAKNAYIGTYYNLSDFL
jgi:histidinol phosphatase-like enzyme